MSHPAVGIDLGTTFSALAVVNPAGKPEIVANAAGERITASAIYFEADGAACIGKDAVGVAGGYPERVVRWVKSEMGNPEWRFEVDGKSHTAVDLSAMILRKVKQDAETVLGTIKYAVVTVPAYFDEVRRKATMDAASKSGLEVLRIINEPTAAALAYASAGRVRGKALIFDYGGGTFDVSIVEINSPQDVVVLASEGDQFGGYDLDKLLAKHFNTLFKKEHGVDCWEEGATDGRATDVRSYDHDTIVKSHNTEMQAEETKCILSRRKERAGIALSSGGDMMNVAVNRGKFEDLIGEHLVRTEMLTEDAMLQAGVKPADIDAVILVGGSTRIPAVQTMLEKKFGRQPVKSINPDEAVALGAALQAGILLQKKGLSDLTGAAADTLRNTRMQDVTNHSYGTFSHEAHGRERLRNTIIIAKNTPIPCSKTESFYTRVRDQTEVDCTITQGDTDDPAFVNTIWESSLELPAGRPANCEIQVTYSYDANQRMCCLFKDVESGRSAGKRDLAVDAAPSKANKPAFEVDESDFDDIFID